MYKPTTLNCSHRSALTILAAIAALFLLIGCASLFRSAGLSPEQAALQSAELHHQITAAATAAVADIQTGLAQGHDLKTIAVNTTSAFAWKIATIAASTIGTLLSALLAKWLGTEKKINKALIVGVEDGDDTSAKKHIHSAALTLGVEPQLNKRVRALT